MVNKPRIANSLAREGRSLKDATAILLARFKNITDAAEHCRPERSTLNEYANPNMPGRHMPIDVVLDLETKIGDPIVSAWLVRQLGYEPYKINKGTSITEVRTAIAEIVKEGSEVFGVSAIAISDGKISPDQAIEISKELDEAIGAFVQYRHLMNRLIEKQNPALHQSA